MTKFEVKDKCTIKVNILGAIPKRVIIHDDKNRIYYFRDLAKNQSEFETNILRAGKYFINLRAEVRAYPLKKYKLNYQLPEAEKYFPHSHFKIVYNPTLVGTPARNFYKEGIIEVGDKFKKLPFQIRLFILCHEVGHSFYHDEQKADLYGCKLFLDMGYTKTMALHALTDVLTCNHANKQRILNIIKALKK
jgi:hypothetical protein